MLERLVSEVCVVMFEYGVVVLDNGIYKIWFVWNYFVYVFNILLFDNVFVFMGVGLFLVMVVKLVNFDELVMVVCGDGGFMMNS